MLLDHSFHGGNAWVWAGVGYLFASVVFFNIVINLALAFLSSAHSHIKAQIAEISTTGHSGNP